MSVAAVEAPQPHVEEAPSSSATEASAAAEKSQKTINDATILTYPFREMNMEWWNEYFYTVSAQRQATVLVRVMDCLMAHAILHEDPFLEETVMFMARKFAQMEPPNVDRALLHSFEVAQHIFNTICVTAKFPTLESQPKMQVLEISRKRLQQVEDTCKQVVMKLGANIVTLTRTALDRIQALKEDIDSRMAFIDAMDALKILFFSVSVRSGVVPRFDLDPSPFDTFVCCDGCPCYARLRTGPTIYLRHMEKAKVIDCLLIAAVKENDALMRDVATSLLTTYKDFMVDPYLDEIGRYIHNGKLFYCRTALFDALNFIESLESAQNDRSHLLANGTSVLNSMVLSLLWVKHEVKTIRAVKDNVPTLDKALQTAEAVYARLTHGDCKQDLRTIKDYVMTVFNSISASQYHFAVHSRDVFVGKPADMKCANPLCPGTTKDLLKCSGCDVTYYCSADCQKADWEKHKSFCHEIESRRTKPTPIECDISPMHCIKPAF